MNLRWIAFNVDTGAGGTVWPMDADYACEKFQVQQVASTKLRQVKWSKKRSGFEFDVRVFRVHQLYMTREKTSVHKPLLSARDVPDKGHALWLDGDGGCIIQNFEKACSQHSWNGASDLTKERGVYNLYVQVAGGDGTSCRCQSQ